MTPGRVAVGIAAIVIAAAILVVVTRSDGTHDTPSGSPADAPSRSSPAPVQPEDAIAEEAELSRIALVFLPAELEIARDYDQRGQVLLRNDGEVAASVKVTAKPVDDLFAGFVGRGSDDWFEPAPVRIGPGETWPFPFIVHANAATRETATIDVEALVRLGGNRWVSAAQGQVHVKMPPPRFEVETSLEAGRDPQEAARLVSLLTIRNAGDSIPELTVSTSPTSGDPGGELAGRIHIAPVVERARLGAGETLVVRIRPRLDNGFASISGPIYLHGLGRTQLVSYAARVPAGKRVFLTLGRCRWRTENNGTRCTNCRLASYSHPPTEGTAADAPAGTSPPPLEPVELLEPTAPARFSRSRLFASEELPSETEEPEDDIVDDEAVDPDAGASTTEAIERESEGVENDNLPAGATGSRFAPDPRTLIPGLEPAGPEDRGRGPWVEPLVSRIDDPAFEDPIFATKEITSWKDERGSAILVTRHRDDRSRLDYYGFLAGGGRAHRTLVAGAHRVLHATLGRGPGGAIVVAYARPSDTGAVIELVDPERNRRCVVSAPGTWSLQPQILGADVAFWSDGRVKRVTVSEDFVPGAEQTVHERASMSLLRARRAPEGSVLVLVRDSEEGLHLGDRAIQGIAGDFLFFEGSPLLVVQDRDGHLWHEGNQLAEGRPGIGRPYLVRAQDGVRLYYHVAAGPPGERRREGTFRRDFRGGSWGPEMLVPQPEAPVTAAAVAVQFTLPWQHAHYKEMNTAIKLNGRLIGRLARHVPNGRYVFPVPASFLEFRQLEGDGAPNLVTMEIEGIGPGNFHVTDLCEIYTLHNLVQEFLVAASEEEAHELARLSWPELRHETPDLLLASNHWQLPRGAAAGQRIDARILAVNLGSAPVPAGEIVVGTPGGELGRGRFPELAPFAFSLVPLSFVLPGTTDGDPVEIIFRSEVTGDLDPHNNELRFYALRELEPDLAGPTRPERIDMERLAGVAAVEGPATVERPFEVPVRSLATWYRIEAPATGTLQVELLDVPEDLVLDLDLFSEEGLPLDADRARLGAGAEHIFMRVGLEPGQVFPADSRLRLWWE